jgi:hypothetical protein
MAVSLLKQPRDGVMGYAAKIRWADDLIELQEVVMAEYHHGLAGRPIPQNPYVETGNAGVRVPHYVNTL